MKQPTSEEIQRVRVWECQREGHSFSTIYAEQSFDPVAIVCTNCGGSWPIGQGLVVHDLSEEARREIAETIARERAA